MTFIDPRFTAFVGVAALLIVIPGPDMALVTRNALAGGRRAGVFTAFGVGLGILGWAIAAACGVAGLLDRSSGAFYVVKFVGAVYLVLLGVRTLFGKEIAAHDDPTPRKPGQRLGARQAVRQGALGNLLNPKAAVIFLSIFPQFLTPGDSALRLVVMLATFETMIVGWLVCYGVVVSRIGRSRAGASAQRMLQRVTGVVLIGLGLRVAVERR